jgi:hypothetical protein
MSFLPSLDTRFVHTMMYVRSAAFMVIIDEPRDTDAWVGRKADFDTKERADPHKAARRRARNDRMVKLLLFMQRK